MKPGTSLVILLTLAFSLPAAAGRVEAVNREWVPWYNLYKTFADTYGNRYTLDGKKLGSDHTAGLVAMNAVASLAAADPRARQFVEAFWNTPIPGGQHRYYDGMLYLLGLLHCSGEFKIWPPR